jgi:preprotein translocase subunit SecF
MRRVIQITKLRIPMFILSLILIIGGLSGTFLKGGMNLGIDFRAGLNQRVQINPSQVTSSISEIRKALGAIEGVQIQSVGDTENQEFIIRVKEPDGAEDFSQSMSAEIIGYLSELYGVQNIQTLSTDYVGSTLSSDLASQTALLTALALGLILVYIWVRFKFGFAISAIIALIHDVLIMVGFIGLLGMEITTATIAAILTIIGYSLNDTIVVFDRVRENENLLRESEYDTIINTSITQSLSRTLITSVTTLLAVIAIFAFTSGAIKDFALNLIVGIVVGTYSSIFIASPVLLGINNSTLMRRKRRDIQKYGKGSIDRSPETAGKPAEKNVTDFKSAADKISSEEDVESASNNVVAFDADAHAPQPNSIVPKKKVSRAKRKRKKK